MKKQFDTFKKEFLAKTLDHLWNQWSVLGVAGAGEIKDMSLVDPEALILLSVKFTGEDMRLADEMLTWLEANGALINTKRLMNLSKQYEFSVNRMLAGMAEYVSASHVNWKRLTQVDYGAEDELEFGSVRKSQAKQDGNFAKHGVYRAGYKNRGLSSGFNFSQKNALLLRLRSLLVMNAHCEILCYYADGRSIHASKAARDLGYSQKAIQETLASMEQSAGVSSYQDGKNKCYKINAALWQSLIPKKVNWKDSIKHYSLVNDVWLLLSEMEGKYKDDGDTTLIATLIKHEYMSWRNKHPVRYDATLERETGEMFIQKWMEWVRK
jgi:hypothetical protein